MSKKLIILLSISLYTYISYAQLSFTTTTTTSTCSANGSILVHATGGTTPYIYQIISSSTGIIRPAQNVSLFQNLPAGTYSIRVTDANNETVVNAAVISGNYLPLSFTATQQQSTIIIQPVNGKAPFTFSYSANGAVFSTPIDSNKFHCMAAGSYLFRVNDSCNNFYTETVVVSPVTFNANFSCVPNAATGTKSITLNSLTNGNGGYSFNAFGVNYNQTNSTGNFTNINKCNKNITVKVTDRCNIQNQFLVCPTPEYTFSISCVNFKDRKVTISNVASGNGLPYQYIANDVVSASATVQSFPIPDDSILAGLIDSCGFKNTIKIDRMKIMYDGFSNCENGAIRIFSYYLIDNRAFSFSPTTYTTISGPTSFNITDASLSDTSSISLNDLESGKYVYKITNSCGDEVIDSFTYSKKCFKKITARKLQSCTTLRIYLEKDCVMDTNALYTLTDMQGNFIAQNTNGFFTGLNNDSCYKILMKDIDCDTTLIDIINPLTPKMRINRNSCDEAFFSVRSTVKRDCGATLGANFTGISNFVLADSLFNVLQINTTGYANPMPPNTYWIYAQASDCNSDTLRYTHGSGFSDTMRFCITPAVRFENNKCKPSWNIRLLNNNSNMTFNLIGNGMNVQGTQNFYGIDSGRYILKNGCNEQELFLPNYYNFKTKINKGCPSNASLTATNTVNSSYIDSLGQKYFFSVCDLVPVDFHLKEVGSNHPLIYSTTGIYNNLKTGTYYAVFYKGDENCHFFSDTVFTPFYTRPALSATYGLICNGNNATVKASVVGGTPPYTYEVLSSSIAPITTDSTYVLYNNLPLGTAQFRVSDVCGISTDYSTEVLSVNFQPTFKRKCDGQVQLIAPDIFNTTYTWTNKNGDTIGTTPIVYVVPNGNDTFSVQIEHLTCSITKSLFVSDFSSSLVHANAGTNFSVDTTTALLHGNTPPLNAIGTWKQIDPSSGNTVFANTHQANTAVTVDVFPGQYTYVWTLTDTTIGCISEDTVVVSFLRCPNIQPLLYTKTVKHATCSNNGEIAITITQSSTPVYFLWNTGDTSSILRNLSDAVYTVIIRDETSCTPDLTDTIVITASKPSFQTISDTICAGDSIIVNNKKYFTAGNYTDTLTNRAGCDSILTIKLVTKAVSNFYDTVTICNRDSYTLPDGQVVTQAGNYSIKTQNTQGCDSFMHYNLIVLPSFHNIKDTAICRGTVYILPDGTGTSSAGIYTDSLTTVSGCDSIIQINLSVKDTLQHLSLGNDTAICSGDVLLLSLNYPSGVQYLWQDSSTQSFLNATKEGIYFVKISDGCFSQTDSVRISNKDCSCNFWIPNAFSPNGDGINDEFSIFSKCEFYKDLSFQIFNRWGELLFETADIRQNWNGTYKQVVQEMDSYAWKLEYYDVLREEKITQKGTLSLLK